MLNCLYTKTLSCCVNHLGLLINTFDRGPSVLSNGFQKNIVLKCPLQANICKRPHEMCRQEFHKAIRKEIKNPLKSDLK